MNLQDFAGLHKLSGVDFGYLDGVNHMLFVCNKKTYRVREDASDGYRSSMRDIELVSEKVTNKFKSQRVFGVLRIGNCDIVDFYDVVTGKIVLSFGTENNDDYYPCYVAVFTPENMAINKDNT